ncbi:uncharacterized protein F5Z01DRAFT_99601 [Emericellopsis atlantica]|uniref:Uncharacterized protein n=1 Tax=Emericellopsis atlantica TaxID=2614577 RepID=A0A9P8CPJ6_9HYPO|nr:uncharacterized protein F5Z01DRAFT_99601 [Emericellopsis atlantica]KAG9254262.1 hypothetical protein F5Z01DRAFT_99601 [Emericellopsis atlantica]
MGYCKQMILDDPYARFKKLDPSRYVLRFLRGGCGSQECRPPTENVWTIPADDSIPVVMNGEKPLQLPPPTKASWERYFIRPASDYSNLGLPREIEIVCTKCHKEVWVDKNPRWTTESSPRYVPRSPRCQTCATKASAYWFPRDTTPWVRVNHLSRKWRSLMSNRAFDPAKIATDPDSYFPSKPAR